MKHILSLVMVFFLIMPYTYAQSEVDCLELAIGLKDSQKKLVLNYLCVKRDLDLIPASTFTSKCSESALERIERFINRYPNQDLNVIYVQAVDKHLSIVPADLHFEKVIAQLESYSLHFKTLRYCIETIGVDSEWEEHGKLVLYVE